MTTIRQIKMCSWNIAGAREKLQNERIHRFLCEFDIIWILETKCIKSKKVPGFITYHNPSVHGSHRGGVLLLVKNYLEKSGMQF